MDTTRVRKGKAEKYRLSENGEKTVKRNWDLFQVAGMRRRLENIALRYDADVKLDVIDVLNRLEDKIRGR